MATFPTYFSVMADIARGMSEADAIAKAARQLADAIDEEAARELLPELFGLSDEQARCGARTPVVAGGPEARCSLAAGHAGPHQVAAPE
jgi:hypothetical protein